MNVRSQAKKNWCFVAVLSLLTGAVLPIGGCPPPSDPTPGQGDADNDGVTNNNDDCPNTPANAEVDDNGCAASQLDSDDDGVNDADDDCADTPPNTDVDANGCPITAGNDADGDGVVNDDDDCPNTPAGSTVDANGCAANQRDSDDDGVTDNVDQCPNTSPTANVDPTGCPVTNPDDPDDDNDGVADAADQCPNTAPNAQVDPNGCAATQRDADGDGVNDATDDCPDTAEGAQVDADGCSNSQRDDDSDGVPNGTDRCPGTPAGSTVGTDGCIPGGGGGGTPVCGNGIREGSEQCEPPNTATCSDTCTTINTGNTTINANNCADRVTVTGEGVFAFDNEAATTDGPAHTECTFSQQDQTIKDVWALWTSPCTGTVFVSTCNLTGLDTKLVVYSGSTCPTASSDPVTCNDDGCGNNSVQSLVSFEAIQGQSFLVRVGMYPDPNTTPLGGTGSVSITCGLDACPSGGACTAPGSGAGCSDEACCERVCTVDPFCCSSRWDSTCVSEAQGLCGSGFTTCGVGAGSCTDVNGNGSPGCDDPDCCNSVCRVDPYCCLTEWDDLCATREATICRSSCGSGAGACDAVHNTPGCNNEACCSEVCPRDPFCCQTEWDQGCVDLANEHCQP